MESATINIQTTIQAVRHVRPLYPGEQGAWITASDRVHPELRQWMILRLLKLNDNKTELLIIMSKYRLGKFGKCTISVAEIITSPVGQVRNLGVQMEQHLTMVPQVTAICASCSLWLHRLSSIHRYLTDEVARTAVQTLITSRLDYCNSLLVSVPAT